MALSETSSGIPSIIYAIPTFQIFQQGFFKEILSEIAQKTLGRIVEDISEGNTKEILE